MKDFTQSISGATGIIHDLKYDSKDFQEKAEDFFKHSTTLQNQISSRVSNSYAQKSRPITRKIISGIASCADKINVVSKQFTDINTEDMKYYAEKGNFYRWLVSLCLLSWTVALCVILLIGIGKASKCILLIFCATGTFTLVLSWMFIGLQLALTIGQNTRRTEFENLPNFIFIFYFGFPLIIQ